MSRSDSFRESLRSALRKRGVSRSLSRIVTASHPDAPLALVDSRRLVLSDRLLDAPEWLAEALADAVALPPGSDQREQSLRKLREWAPQTRTVRWSERLRRAMIDTTASAAENLPPFSYPRGDDPELPELPVVDGFVFSPETPYVLSALDSGEHNVLLVGPSGCGKSSTIALLAAFRGHELFEINLSAGSRAADFLGCREVKVDRESGLAVTAWTDGVLLRAMTYRHPETGRGAWLLVDEFDFAGPEVLVSLYHALEPRRPRRVVVPEDGGRVVEATRDFRLCMTANTAGHGDEDGVFAGSRVQNSALMDRLCIFRLEHTPHEAELLARYITDEEAELLVAWATEVRAQVGAGRLSTPLSTRVLLRIAQTVREWGLAKTFEIEVLNRLRSEERAAVAELCHAMLGVDL